VPETIPLEAREEGFPYLEEVIPNGKFDQADNFLWQRGDPPFVLLNAHMDTKQHEDDVQMILDDPNLIEETIERISGNGVQVGFDDKCGLSIALAIVEETDLPLKLLFTVEEECGGNGIINVERSEYDDVSFSLTLDRGGAIDIADRIPLFGRLAPKRFVKEMVKIGEERDLHRRRMDGRPCDAANIAQIVPAVNLSVGYCGAHASNDFCIKENVDGAMKFTMAIIEERGRLVDLL